MQAKRFFTLFVAFVLFSSVTFVQHHAHLLLDETHHCHIDEHSEPLEHALVERFVLVSTVAQIALEVVEEKEETKVVKPLPKSCYKVVKTLHQKYKFTQHNAPPILTYKATAPPHLFT